MVFCSMPNCLLNASFISLESGFECEEIICTVAPLEIFPTFFFAVTLNVVAVIINFYYLQIYYETIIDFLPNFAQFLNLFFYIKQNPNFVL